MNMFLVTNVVAMYNDESNDVPINMAIFTDYDCAKEYLTLKFNDVGLIRRINVQIEKNPCSTQIFEPVLHAVAQTCNHQASISTFVKCPVIVKHKYPRTKEQQ